MDGTVSDGPFAVVAQAQTSAPNYELDTGAIIDRLVQWQSLCSFKVTGATADTVDIEFSTLPPDMDAFVRDLYAFCPDLVDQGTGCVQEILEGLEEVGEAPTPEMKALTEGVDLSDENHGLEILKREIQWNKKLTLWWD